jgi:serine/threonine-protein kinase
MLSFLMSDARTALENNAKTKVGTTLLNKWTLERVIDVGGMGAVYAATHRNGKKFAIKILHSQYAADEQLRTRFLREGYVANKIGHPGVVSIIDDDTAEDGSVFLVMELLEGESFEARLARHGNRLAPDAIFGIIDPVLDVLAAAHAQGVIHRDLKPGNLFITREGQVKVLDFGLAHVRERTYDARLTRTGMVMGTASYMPPEQARAKWALVDARTDIWAIGATMFRALTGRAVHNAPNHVDRMLAAMSQHAPPIASLVPEIPAGLSLVIDRALAFQKDDRWDDARAMQKALRYAYRDFDRQRIESQAPPPLLALPPDTERAPFLLPTPDSLGPLSINVVVDEVDSRGSIVVEFSEAQSKPALKYELKSSDEPESARLSEVIVISSVQDVDERS